VKNALIQTNNNFEEAARLLININLERNQGIQRKVLGDLFNCPSEKIEDILVREKNFILTLETLCAFFILKAKFDLRQTIIFKVF
jgi:hypothetical protein